MPKSITELIPELDPSARLRHPGRDKEGRAKTGTKKIRQSLKDARKLPVGFVSPSQDEASAASRSPEVARLQDKLRQRWVALYLDVAPGKSEIYESVLDVNGLRSFRDEAQAVVVQTVGAIEERLRAVDLTIDHIFTSMRITDEALAAQARGNVDDRGDARLMEPTDWSSNFSTVSALPYQDELRDWILEVGEALRADLELRQTIDTPAQRNSACELT